MDTAGDIVRVPSANPAARRLLAGEVLDPQTRATALRGRDGLPCRFANNGDLGDALCVTPTPQCIGIEAPFMMRAGVALHPDQHVDSAEAHTCRRDEPDEFALIGACNRSGDPCRHEPVRTARSTEHHITDLTVDTREALCGSGSNSSCRKRIEPRGCRCVSSTVHVFVIRVWQGPGGRR